MASFQAIEWLKAAYSDIKTIEYMLEDSFLIHMVAFHSQQAIEKSFKTILEDASISIPKVYKLETLVSKINVKIEFNSQILATL